jgi:hypothetical protein
MHALDERAWPTLGGQTAGALALLVRDWCEVRLQPGRARPHPGGA